jgi:hypothetical protein
MFDTERLRKRFPCQCINKRQNTPASRAAARVGIPKSVDAQTIVDIPMAAVSTVRCGKLPNYP